MDGFAKLYRVWPRIVPRLYIRKSALLHLASVGVGTAIFAVGASLTVQSIVTSQNHARVKQFTRSIVAASETAVDYGFMSLVEVIGDVGDHCNAAMLASFRRQVFLNGNLRDIRYYNKSGKLLCAAFPETLKLENQAAGDRTQLKASNRSVSLFTLNQKDGSALGLSWHQTTGERLVAIFDAGALLFNSLPGELRDRSQLQLLMSDGSPIAQINPETGDFDKAVSRAEAAKSERYPLEARLFYMPGKLWKLDETLQTLLIIGAGLLGAIFGLLVHRTIIRPDDPIREIRQGLKRREFVPYIQPTFCLSSGRLIGGEILVRWIRNDRVILPSQFIRAVEDSGQIGEMTTYLLAVALDELKQLLKRHKKMKFGFNIAAKHLLSPDFAKEIKDIVYASGVSRKQVILELTERQEITDIEQAAKVVADLQFDGFVVALDDVGTGHSGLTQIQKLNPDILKIDKFFVDLVCADRLAEVVVSSLVRLATESKMDTLAEGIENEEQIERLRDLGVVHGQGFFIAKPMDIDSFYRFVAAYDASKVARKHETDAQYLPNSPIPLRA